MKKMVLGAFSDGHRSVTFLFIGGYVYTGTGTRSRRILQYQGGPVKARKYSSGKCSD